MLKSNITSTPLNVRHLLLSLFLTGTLIGITPEVYSQDLDVPYVPTPEDVVEKMLDLVEVKPSDYVVDLGSGDGRIVIAAAKRGAIGHGVDLDPQRIEEARENAEKAGVSDQIIFRQENIFDTDFSKASVITMYLLPSINKRLRPELLDRLEPGTRIVSHSFDMGDWKPDKQVSVDNQSRSHQIYYWVIPAKVNGDWNWSSNSNNFTLSLEQQYQEITADLKDSEGNSYNVSKADLHGKRLTIHAENGDQHYIFSGRVEGDEITGMMQEHNGSDKSFAAWDASRK